ncbi:MAG TPA: hypothetical protein VLR89_10255 [Anaerolineaceae bacterium]|nr:hypothetical protein [Anaerolineaceae bacterium]
MTISPVTRIKKTYVYGIAGVIIGLVLGLIVGWVIWPVSWTDASSANLRPEMQQTVMSNAILSFTLTNDKEKALQVYQDFGAKAASALDAVRSNPGLLNAEQISRFATAVSAPVSGTNALPATNATGDTSTNPMPISKKSTGTLGLALLVVLVAGAAAVYWFFFRGHEANGNPNMSMVSKTSSTLMPQATKPTFTPSKTPVSNQNTSQQRRIEMPAVLNQATQTTSQVLQATPAAISPVSHPVMVPSGKPIAQFLTTYMYGDDLYDESFIFDAPNGAFLGECGVSFSDIVGTGEPKKISAFEIWLFDKNDVQTVTNVLMCQHAFDDLFMRENLEKKGDSVLAEVEKRFAMETASLVLEGHVVDLTYGELLQTPQSYFQRLTLELAVYEKK